MRQIVRLYSLATLLALAANASALDTAFGALDTDIIAGSSSIGSQVDPASNASDASNAARTGKGAFKGLAMPSAASKTKQQVLDEIFWENQWKNSLITWMLPDALREVMPHWAQSWFRCWAMAQVLYLAVGGAWVYYTYYCFGSQLYRPGTIPAFTDVMEQIKVAVLAMPLYAALPAATEYIVESGWTLAYARISDVGLAKYCIYFALYMCSVEFFVYWQHRLLHDIRPGYRYLHHIHHKYNKEHTLSPFAGLAFHPLDGILQAIPYTWTLLFIPMHFLTHELLLFATAIWTTNIHDCLHGKVDPIMGAGYHTIHHTTYKHNYGHYLTYMDGLFGTLITPEAFEKEHTGGNIKTS